MLLREAYEVCGRRIRSARTRTAARATAALAMLRCLFSRTSAPASVLTTARGIRGIWCTREFVEYCACLLGETGGEAGGVDPLCADRSVADSVFVLCRKELVAGGTNMTCSEICQPLGCLASIKLGSSHAGQVACFYGERNSVLANAGWPRPQAVSAAVKLEEIHVIYEEPVTCDIAPLADEAQICVCTMTPSECRFVCQWCVGVQAFFLQWHCLLGADVVCERVLCGGVC